MEVDFAAFRRAVIEWAPFTLTEAEYNAFLRQLRSLGMTFDVKDYGVRDYGAWFEKCFAQNEVVSTPV